MSFTRVCAVDDLERGDMAAFFVDGREVLVVRDDSGAVRAFDGLCPHEDFPLVNGDFDGRVLTCINHLWSFDATTGQGISPPTCRLDVWAVKVEGDEIFVSPHVEPSSPPAD